MSNPEHIFWDSCVFIRYLTELPSDFVGDISAYIKDVKDGSRKVYYSTIVYTEIRQRYFDYPGQNGTGSYRGTVELFEDLGRNFIPIEPSPNILLDAGQMRSVDSVNPDPKALSNRVLSTPDAIHLATCLFARDVFGLDEIVFQTFDAGKRGNHDGKCIPMLGFERWYPERVRTPIIQGVCSMPRGLPEHPQPSMFGRLP